jgi:energy-coupling factor transporter ATP-binding protein EcfA2
MGLVLFSGEEGEKQLGALSGGEAARLVFCKLSIQKPNVLVLDEPTNHLDLEAIEALVESLKSFEGTLILVSHDRWFVSQLANRIVEITPDGIRDYKGTYEAYVHACGDDHLDVDTVVLKARKEKRGDAGRADGDGDGAGRGTESTGAVGGGNESGSRKKGRKERGRSRTQLQALTKRRDEITARLDQAETRVEEIDKTFCEADFYDRTPQDEVRALESERTGLLAEVEKLVADWERVEQELEELEGS